MTAPPTNLPEEPSPFIGRGRELRELQHALGSTRALTLCGAGGIGKTRLAMRLLATVGDRFPDGVWLVELGDLWEPQLVAARIAAAIGVDGEPGRPLLDTLADAIASRTLLIALDNCEHLITACAQACQRLLAASPSLRIVATSREPLHLPAEAVWQVAPLSVPPAPAQPGMPSTGGLDPPDLASYESVRLFVARAGAVRPGFTLTPANAEAVASLCRALDGVPLAIELAAARTNVLSAEQIASRIGNRFSLLDTGDRTAPPRQRTLRATIDWSHSLLTGSEQMLLRRLSVFAGWSLEMAEQVCAGDGLPASEIIDLTTALVDKSLAVVEPEVLGQTRYRLLDTIREYAAERLAAAGETRAVHDRMRDYTLRVAQYSEAIGMGTIPAPWSAVVDVFRRYDVDGDNARLVLSRCLASSDAETGLRICTAIRPCWIARGAFAEGSEWFARFLAPRTGSLPLQVRGAALVGRAQLVLANEPAMAHAWASEGLAACRAAGEEVWTATALNLLAEAALHSGQLAEAAGAVAEALQVARTASDGWNEGYALGTQAALAAASGHLREAAELGEAALAVMRRIDQRWGVARTLLGLGALTRLRGDLDGALKYYLAALPALREIDSRPDIARCLAGIGRIALDQGDLTLARQHLTESLQLSYATGSRVGIARGLETFATLAGRDGRPDLSVRLTAAAASLRETAGLPALSGARTQRQLAPARELGEVAVGRLWADGKALTPGAAVTLATASLGTGGGAGAGRRGHPGQADGGTGAELAGATVIPAVPAQTPPATLTQRERQVVALLAAGHSNRALASDLAISPATAARHVANISRKLGLSSRAQIAAWAARNGPWEEGNGAARSSQD